MQARNELLFAPVQMYNRAGPEQLLYNLQLFRKLNNDASWMPKSEENACARCSICAEKCPKRLDIKHAIEDTFQRVKTSYYSQHHRKDRLSELLYDKGYRRVGLYPSGGFSSLVMQLYHEFFGEPGFQWVLLNGNQQTWGQSPDGYIYGPAEIPGLDLDLLVVVSYSYMDDIMESLKFYEQQGVKVVALHRSQEMPWVF